MKGTNGLIGKEDAKFVINRVKNGLGQPLSDLAKKSFFPLMGLVISAIMFFPFYWLIKVTLTWPIESLYTDTNLLIDTVSLYNIARVIDMIPFLQHVKNSVVITSMAVFGAVMFNIFAGYALTLDFFGKNKVMTFLLVVMMVPVYITIIPTFMVINKVGLLNTRLGVAIPFMTIVIGILILKNSFESIPDTLKEAARVDGASELFIIFGVYCPIAKPAIAANVILVGLLAWNSYLWPLIIISDKHLQPLPLAIARLQGIMGANYTILYAFALIVLVPMIILFLLLQRHFVNSVTMGTMKK